MKKWPLFALIVGLLLVGGLFPATGGVGRGGAVQSPSSGDTNGDGKLDISDAISLLGFLFTGGPPPASCFAQSGIHAQDIGFDPKDSGLSAANVQAAILELHATNNELQRRLQVLEDALGQQTVEIALVQIPAGTFLMGSPTTEKGRQDNETLHRVNISKPFMMGATLVTQEQFNKVMGYNPSIFADCTKCPVESLTYFQAMEFLHRLTDLHRSAGRIGTKDSYRLPTEAEWEYACRAGTTTRFFFGNALECTDDDAFCSIVDEYAWYRGNIDIGTKPVGGKKPNPWGLYDMVGMVIQMCQDWYAPYPVGEVTDPRGPSDHPPGQYYRVGRGGHTGSGISGDRSAFRWPLPMTDHQSAFGFRVVLEVSQ